MAAVEGDEKQFSHSEKRARIRQEIIDTEDSYVTNLNLLTAVYVAHLNKEKHNAKDYSLTEKDFDIMTSNLTTLTNMHNAFLSELRDTDPVEVAVVLNKYADLFKMYIFYLNGYEACLQTLSKMKSHRKGKHLLDDIEHKLRASGGGLSLMSLMIMPVQRIPRYVLLLAELIKSSSENHPQYKNMTEAHLKVAKIASTINDAKRRMEAMSKLVEVAARISGVPSTFHIVLPYRRLVREGHLTVVMESAAGSKASMKKTPRHIFLFNDYIVISKAGHDLVWKGSLTLSAATIDHNGDTFSITTAKMFISFKVEAEGESVEAWVHDISEQMEKLKKLRDSKRSINARTKRSLGGHTLGKDGSVHNLILGSLSTLKREGSIEHHRESSVSHPHDHNDSSSSTHHDHDHDHEGDDFDHHAPDHHHDHDDHYHHDDHDDPDHHHH